LAIIIDPTSAGELRRDAEMIPRVIPTTMAKTSA
jgi:hypothetical protein